VNSLTKAQIKHIKGLASKINCESANSFLAEGGKCIQELLNAGFIPEQLWASAKVHHQFEHSQLVPDYILEQITALKNHANIVGVFELPKPLYGNKMVDLSIALDGIQDPGNMGTIIRIADWVGIRTIYASQDCAYAYLPKVVQATMGSIARVDIVYTDLEKVFSLNPTVNKYAAALVGSNLYSFAPMLEGCIVMGSEGKGITENLLDQCDSKITIPGAGDAESLNVAVATGIIASYLMRD
jgi:RNA methyltransferase, TrmH family